MDAILKVKHKPFFQEVLWVNSSLFSAKT